MSLCLTRAMLRQQQLARQLQRSANPNAGFRRQASNVSDQANAAKDKATQMASKASEGLSKVVSQAGPLLSKAGSVAGSTLNALGSVGGRTGRLIGFVQSLVPPTIYYSKVGLELSKLVFHGRQMSPPTLQTVQAYWEPVLKSLRDPAKLFAKTSTQTNTMTPAHILGRIRNLSNQELASAGVVGAEILGFFTVGEMIGRFKIVGYRGEVAHH